MNVLVLIAFLIACFAILFAMERANEAWLSWQVNRALRRVGQPGPKLEPESRFVVRVSDAEVVSERPDHTIEQVRWDALERVEIVSTGEGPMHPDMFWVLHGVSGGCAIPWGASGESVLLARLQQLPGFDNQAVIRAASQASAARWTCCERGRRARAS